MHVVVVGCGRVGSELAGTLEKQGHTVAVIDKRKDAFRRLPTGFGGYRIVGFGFDRDTLDGSRRPGRRRARGGDERRQLEHHVGARRPRDVRGRAGRRPHLRPPPGRDLPAPRHPDRRHRVVDDRPGACAGCSPASTRRTGPTRAARSRSSSATSRPSWAGQKLAKLDEPGRFARHRGHPPRRGPGRRARPRRPGGRRPPLHGRRDRDRRAAGAPERRRRRACTTDARRGRGRGKRRRVHRQRARRERSRGAADRERPERRGEAADAPTASRCTSATRARSRR